MNLPKSYVLLLLFIPFVSSCASIKGSSFKEQREYVLDMREGVLAELFEERPIAESQIKKAAGYGVFSNIGTNLFLVSTGNGYGVVRNNKTKEETYMKMGSVGLGLGLGVKDFRAIIIFRNEEDLEDFVDEGWEFKGQADAAAISGDKGLAGSVAQTVDLDVITYQITEAGVALQATLQGTKYWKHKDLN